MHGAQATGNVHTGIHDVGPDAVERRFQCRVTSLCQHIRHAGIQISGADGVSHGFGLLADRQVLLGIAGCHYAFAFRLEGYASDVDKPLGHLQVERVAGGMVEFHQCQFYLFVTGCLVDWFTSVVRGISFKEHVVDVSCILFGNLQPFVFSRCLIIGHGTFVHVSHVVKFVAVQHKRVGLIAHTSATPVVVFGRYAGDVRFIQVSVGLLCVAYEVDDAVHGVFQCRVFLQSQQIGSPFHHLVEVGCYETMRERQLVFDAMQVVACFSEVVHSRTYLVEGERYKYFFLCFQAGKPKIVFQRYLLKGNGLQYFRTFGFVH